MRSAPVPIAADKLGMASPPARPAPIGAYLAIAGGALALISLGLPWFTLDAEAFKAAFQEIMRQVMAAGGGETSIVDGQQAQAFASIAADRASAEIEGNLNGYQDSIPWVAFRAIAALGVLTLGFTVVRGDVSGASQRATLLGAGVALAVRPVMNLLDNPFKGFDDAPGSFGLKASELVAPASGIYLALLGAVLLVGAGLLAHVGDRDASPAAEPATSSGGHTAVATPSPAHAAATAYVPPGPPTPHQPAPAASVPSGPPTPQAHPAHATYTPLAPRATTDHAPYIPAQSAPPQPAAPAPYAAPQPAAARTGSVAPPGL